MDDSVSDPFELRSFCGALEAVVATAATRMSARQVTGVFRALETNPTRALRDGEMDPPSSPVS